MDGSSRRSEILEHVPNLFRGCMTSQLKITHPTHVLVERAGAGEAAFERAVQSVA